MSGAGGAAADAHHRGGVLAGLGAYLIWGGMPLFFLLLAPASAWEIIAHRILWSLVLCGGILAATGRLSALGAALRRPRVLGGVALASVAIAVNWIVYVLAVLWGRVTEAALGYFLNPLVSVALGVLVLGERLRPLQWAAVAVGSAGACVLSFAAGAPSWVAVTLAFSFGSYGLIKKRLGSSLDAVSSMTAETLVLAPLAAGALVWVGTTGGATFTAYGVSHAVTLASAGIVTSVPLVLFAEATRRISLVTVGLLQFLAPVLQFLTGLALGEHLSAGRWAGFAIVWLALALLVVDTVRAARTRTTRATRTSLGPDEPAPAA